MRSSKIMDENISSSTVRRSSSSKSTFWLLPFDTHRRLPVSILHCATALFLISASIVPLPTDSQEILEVRYNLVEDQPAGTYVGNVLLDANLSRLYSPSDLRRLQFRFMRQHSMGYEVDATSGVIRTMTVIDRDASCPGAPLCTVRLDVGIQPVEFFRLIRVTITIIDVNDHDPLFAPNDRLTFELLESSAVGTVLTLPGATDRDSPTFSIHSYTLQTVPESDNFLLDSTGRQVDGSPGLRLILVKSLDRELVSEYQLTVTAFDGGSPPRSGTLKVRIEVSDANDNSPAFDRDRYEVTIPENIPLRSIIIVVAATDADLGANAQVLYSFSQFTANAYGHLFAIDNMTGDVYVTGTIDHETSAVHHLVVVAQDLGVDPASSTALVIVNVEDVNDNAPEISYDSLSQSEGADAEVREDAPVGTFVVHLSVTDGDSGENGRFNCSLVADDWPFQLKALSETEFQIHLSAPVDREIRETYNLTVACTDFGQPPLLSTQSIQVLVTDVNDWSPVFSQPLYQTELIENNYIGAFVVQVEAFDRDKAQNSRIVYSIVGNATDRFRVDPSTGVITALISFDRESTEGTAFHVVARDRGTPSRSGSTTVVIVISDVNDNRPSYNASFYRFSVAENEAPETEVGVVVAADADTGLNGDVFYFLAPSPSSALFRVSSDTGRIQTVMPLDREETSVHYLRVIASDRGVPPLTTTVGVTVLVTDTNDNAPRFEYPLPSNDSVYVSDQAPIGYEVARIRTSDADIGSNAHTTFRFGNRSTTDTLFRIDNHTGIVTVDGDLSGLDGRRFDFRIVACDAGFPIIRESLTLLHVYVNRSALLLTSEGFRLLSGPHLTIVISLAVVCGVVTAGLIIAIIVMRRKKIVKYEHHYNCRTATLRMFPSQSSGAMPARGTANGAVCFAYSSSEAGSMTVNDATNRSRSPVEDGSGSGRRDLGELSSSTKRLLQTNQRSSEWSIGGNGTGGGIGGGGSRYQDSLASDPKVQPLLRSSSTKFHLVEDDDGSALQLPHACKTDAGRSTSSNIIHMAAPPGSPSQPPSSQGSRTTPVRSSDQFRAEMEVNHLLEILKDNDAGSLHSGEGSNTDSGRGPSEEGGDAAKKSIEQNMGGRRGGGVDGGVVPETGDTYAYASKAPCPESGSCPGVHTSRLRPACSPHSSCRTTTPAAVIVSSSSPKTSQVHPVGPRPSALPNHYYLEQRISPNQSITTRYHDPQNFELAHPQPLVASSSPADKNKRPSHQQQQNQPQQLRSYSDLLCRQYAPVHTNGGPAFDDGTSRRDGISTRPGYREMTDCGRYSGRKIDPRVAPSRCWDDDDDAATTTSGSYVVDPKELCEEIDELFFKDNGKAL